MRIEELVLEGFKSYPVRTQITGWDPSFNAITGLNGSGKSNILDAIAFVLGLTNMSIMRANNLADLIYKRGQAGVNKASVTIVFDNSDESKSPDGFANCRQITVTRQVALPNVTKWLLNGHKSTQQAVQTLFQSVQLNINNPNFVIMQGRITKVLNMKPQEILGMVEEAAGTRMFEDRKDKAKKTMAKKEKRVQEITNTLHEDIAPKLERLRQEKRAFLDWQKACTELERVGKILRAYQWTELQKKIKEKQAEKEEEEEKKNRTKKDKKKLLEEVKEAGKEQARVTEQRDAEMKKGGKLAKLQEEVAALDKDLTKVRTQSDIKSESIKDEQKKIASSQQEIQRLEESLVQKKKEVDDKTASYMKVKEEHTASEAKLSSDEELLQSLQTGLSGNATHNNGGGYMGQIADARARLAQAAAEESQASVQLDMSKKELKDLETRWKAVQSEAEASKKSLASIKTEAEHLRQKLSTWGWNQEMEDQHQKKLRDIHTEIKRLTEIRDRTRQYMGSLDFDYDAPFGFNKSKVKGRLGSLIRLDKENHDKATALEIAAGGKLFNVVVENENVGKALLGLGLKKRVTLIPLNKIEGRRLDQRKVEAARKLAPGQVHLAIDLIGYPQELSNAMAYAFGTTLICANGDVAKKVTFSKDVYARSVTLQGDVYDPSGTLSGGSAPNSSGILVKVQDYLRASAELNDKELVLAQLEQKERTHGKKREEWKVMQKDLDLREHNIRLQEAQNDSSNATRIGADVDALKKKIVDLQVDIKSAKDRQKEADEECKKLQRDMSEFKNNKEGKIAELKDAISDRKRAIQQHSVTLKKKQKDMQTAVLEYEQMEQDIAAAKEVLDEIQGSIANLQRELEKGATELAKIQASYDKAKKKVDEERAELSRFDNELEELDRVIKKKKEEVAQKDIDLTTIDHHIQTIGKEETSYHNRVAKLEEQYPWILEEHTQFNKPGKAYDFSTIDPKQLESRVVDLEKTRDGKKKKINPKVMNTIETVEKKEQDSKRMLSTVMKDKEKIEETIEQLDQYKREALQKTWEKVNTDFGGIFAELLPGNFAKLQPPEGQDLMDGLEVKVQLGSVWKQSLTELSGGQRSLIALSLIMSLLQYKPAPMYILDEIDAALDLSHTQHIGQLFRTRFKGSQFIVVSLKEGLFTNANVLFKAKFLDGTSVVERTAHRTTSTLYDRHADEDQGARGGRRSRR